MKCLIAFNLSNYFIDKNYSRDNGQTLINNNKLISKFNKQGYPTVIINVSKQTEAGRDNYPQRQNYEDWQLSKKVIQPSLVLNFSFRRSELSEKEYKNIFMMEELKDVLTKNKVKEVYFSGFYLDQEIINIYDYFRELKTKNFIVLDCCKGNRKNLWDFLTVELSNKTNLITLKEIQ